MSKMTILDVLIRHTVAAKDPDVFIPIVMIETPYRGADRRERVRNEAYAKQCLFDSLMRGEVPLASHLIYPQILDEDVPAERDLGIAMAIALGQRADTIAFYIDHGMTRGMELAYQAADRRGKTIEKRYLFNEED